MYLDITYHLESSSAASKSSLLGDYPVRVDRLSEKVFHDSDHEAVERRRSVVPLLEPSRVGFVICWRRSSIGYQRCWSRPTFLHLLRRGRWKTTTNWSDDDTLWDDTSDFDESIDLWRPGGRLSPREMWHCCDWMYDVMLTYLQCWAQNLSKSVASNYP